MARLPYADLSAPDAAPLVERIVAERGNVLHLYQMLLHSPPIAEGWLGFLTAVRQKSAMVASVSGKGTDRSRGALSGHRLDAASVGPERGVRRPEQQAFGLGLRHQQAIEGVAVVPRQVRHAQHMGRQDVQLGEPLCQQPAPQHRR